VVGHIQVAWTLESDDPVSGFPGLSTDVFKQTNVHSDKSGKTPL